jgi:hypothetical protein
MIDDLRFRNKIKLKIIFICLFAYLLTCLFVPKLQVQAQTVPQQFLDVSPVIQDLTLQPGTTITYPLMITNKGDKPVGFHIDITGIDPTSDTSLPLIAEHSPLLSWIRITPSDLIVAPHDKNSFIVIITTPKNARNSGYYATLFLTPFISSPLKTSGPIILERIGTLLLATVGQLNYTDLVKKVHITNFSYIAAGLAPPMQMQFSVNNAYFTHFSAKPFLTLSSLLDKEVRTFPDEKHVLPGGSRNWIVPIQSHWYTIYSSARLAVSIGNGEQLFAETTYINYALIFSIVLLICFVLFITKRRKQFKKAITILLSGHE